MIYKTSSNTQLWRNETLHSKFKTKWRLPAYLFNLMMNSVLK